MKTFNISFAVLLLSCLLLSFIAPNNLSNSTDKLQKPVDENVVFDQQNPSPEADTLSFKALNHFISVELIRPLEFCFEKKDPHMFMTKCYTRIYFQLSNSDRNRQLYKDYEIRGSIIFNNCNEESRIADLSINYTDKTISVKESYRGASQNYKEYLKDICQYVDKNGVPK
jgi:hypothetical protein